MHLTLTINLKDGREFTDIEVKGGTTPSCIWNTISRELGVRDILTDQVSSYMLVLVPR